MSAPGRPSRGAAISGGVSVLVLTGIAGLSEFVRPGTGITTKLAGIVLLALLLGAAYLLARFIARHGDEIGEARFDTTGQACPPRDEAEKVDA